MAGEKSAWGARLRGRPQSSVLGCLIQGEQYNSLTMPLAWLKLHELLALDDMLN
jgi:hypothetical protein